ncbi:MAG: threonine--tRNA ligase [Planctomycetota bacterium]
MVTITLPDGGCIEIEQGQTVADAAVKIGKKLAKAAIAARVNGEPADLSKKIEQDATLQIITDSAPEALEILRHSAAHVMAAAVKNIIPGAKFGIGPAIESGFYYDFDIGRPLTEADIAAVEAEMHRIIQADLPFVRSEPSKAEALAAMTKAGEVYKAEIVSELADGTVSLYTTGAFVDLCRGPHIPAAGRIKAFKLLSIAGAYWRGDSKNPMLQRIYGTAFFAQAELDEHLRLLEEAKKRDHRRIGQDMDLFSFHELAPGFLFWHPNGVIVFNEVVTFWKERHRVRDYQEIKTPLILNAELWHLSGHWDHYKENMYFTNIEEKSNAVKPMNCPGGLLIFGHKRHSYRDFPLRVAELGTVHRHELSGVLHGLFRVRAFTQDDAHIFCTPDQIESEIVGVIELLLELYRAFGLRDYHVELSTRPAKSIGSDADWNTAENALTAALARSGLQYKLNPGDGAFYGPKIDFHIRDSMKRSWQCGTIQLDFSMPVRFAEGGMNIAYVDRDNTQKIPVMIHRAALGSLERFIGVLIEEYAGKFPLWLAPVQAVVATITDAQNEYAQDLVARLREGGLRARADLRNEKLGYKVREAITQHVPYILVVGDRELAETTVNVRHRDIKDAGTLPRDAVVAGLVREYRERRLASVFAT